MTRTKNDKNSPKNILDTKFVKAAFREAFFVLLGAVLISGLVNLLALMPNELGKTFISIAHEFDLHGKNARASFPVLAMCIVALPLVFFPHPFYGPIFSQFAEKTVKFLSHLILAAIGLGAFSLFRVTSSPVVSFLFFSAWYAIASGLMLMAHGYSEPLTVSNPKLLGVVNVIAIILLVALMWHLPEAHKIELLVK
jgi:hypothetical protein